MILRSDGSLPKLPSGFLFFFWVTYGSASHLQALLTFSRGEYLHTHRCSHRRTSDKVPCMLRPLLTQNSMDRTGALINRVQSVEWIVSMSPITNMCIDKCTFMSSCIQWHTIQAYSDNIPGVLPLCPVDFPTPMLPLLPHHHTCGSLCPITIVGHLVIPSHYPFLNPTAPSRRSSRRPSWPSRF